MKMKIDFSKLVLDVSWHGGYDIETRLETLNWFLKTGKKHRQKNGWYEFGVSQHIFGYSANECDAYFPIPILYKKVNGEFYSMNIKVLSLFFQSVFTNAVLTNGSNAVTSWRKEERIALGKYRMLNFNMEEPEIKSKWYRGTYNFLTSIKHYVGNGSLLDDVKLCTIGDGYIFEMYVKSEISIKKHVLSQEKGESIACFVNRVILEIENLFGDDFFLSKNFKGEYETQNSRN